MTWNYRVMRRSPLMKDEAAMYDVYEVFYDEHGDVKGWSETPSAPTGEDLDILRRDLERHAEALAKPVLDWETGKEIKGIK